MTTEKEIDPNDYYPKECFTNGRTNLPRQLKIIQSSSKRLQNGDLKEEVDLSFENNYKDKFKFFNFKDIESLKKDEVNQNHKDSAGTLRQIKELENSKRKSLESHRKVIQKILKQRMSEHEKTERKFYKSLDSSNSDEESYLTQLFKQLQDKKEFWIKKNDKEVFDLETYFALLQSLRLLRHYKINDISVKKDEIPEIVEKYREWYADIGESKRKYFSEKKIQEGDLIFLIYKNNVPIWIKIHLICRFVMRRNKALSGKRNFKQYSKIREDGNNALYYAERLLHKAKSDWDETSYLTDNKFTDVHAIERSLYVQKMLFAVRAEKNPDNIIKITTETLGLVLTHKNKILKGISSFWCYHVLWRCFLCIGDYETANSFKLSAESTSQQLEDIYEINYSKKFELYDESIPTKHKKGLINMIIEEEIEPLTKNVQQKKHFPYNMSIWESRIDFYVEFIGYNKHKRMSGTKGNSLDLFIKRDSRGGDISKAKELIEKIPEYFREVMIYLGQSHSIVSIPTIRLVIIDLLLFFSRVSLYVNKMNKDISKEEWVTGDKIWKNYTNSIFTLIESIIEVKNSLEMRMGKEKLRDFEYIIAELEKIRKGKKPERFNVLTGKSKKVEELFIPKNAGLDIQTLLKKIVDPKWELHFPLYFPLMVKK